MLATIPNLLTLARMVAVPALVALIARGTAGADVAAALLFAAAAVTDWLDGALARALRQASEIGRMMDPIADKLLVAAALFMLAGTGRLDNGLALYAAAAIVLRELLVSGLREFLATRSAVLRVTWRAKWKAAAQMAALLLLLLGEPGAQRLGLPGPSVAWAGVGLLWAAALLTLASGWDYLVLAVRRAEPAG